MDLPVASRKELSVVDDIMTRFKRSLQSTDHYYIERAIFGYYVYEGEPENYPWVYVLDYTFTLRGAKRVIRKAQTAKDSKTISRKVVFRV